jgi:hypothetical protein
MPDQTLEAPPPIQFPDADPRRPPHPRRVQLAGGFLRSPWPLSTVALLAGRCQDLRLVYR